MTDSAIPVPPLPAGISPDDAYRRGYRDAQQHSARRIRELVALLRRYMPALKWED